MSCERKTLLKLCVVVLTAMVLVAPTTANAQRPRTGVERRQQPGKGFWANERASRSVQHARNYSRDLYRYSQAARTMQPSVAKAESAELGRNIAKAKQELAIARQEAADDPATVTTLKTIDAHLDTAAKQHEMLDMECCKESVDGMTCMKHCNQILLELDKAQAEHDALMRSIEIKSGKTDKEAATAHEHE